MGNPVFRFTLSNTVVGTKIISEPIGWNKAKLKLERHPEFHSLVEYFEGDFTFYGNNGIDDGGLDFILNVENRFGFDGQIDIYIDVSYDDGTDYEPVFHGQLDLTSLKHFKDNKISVPIIRDSTWAKFIARRNIPVYLNSTTDLDGNPVTPVQPITVNLPSQNVRQKYEAHHDHDITISYAIPDNQYGQIDFSDERVKEIDDKYDLPRVESVTLPSQLFSMFYAGTYTFNIQVYTSTSSILGSATDPNLDVRLQINNTVITLAKTNEGIVAVDGRTKHTYTGTHTLSKKDTVRLYLYNNNATGTTYSFVVPANLFYDSFLTITADTVYPSSEAKGYLIHDVFAGIINRICGANSFYSSLFGGTVTNSRAYASNGCHWAYFLVRGLQIRGYTLELKAFSISFDDAWKGADPIFGLSFGYDVIGSERVLRLEDRAHHYNSTLTSVNFSDVQDIERSIDESVIFNKIEIGYDKYQSEDISGLDDPQTKHVYSSSIQKKISGEDKEIGGTLTLHSKFIAASIAIEVTRRKTIKETADYKYDDETFIIALNTDDLSPDRYQPELIENFSSVTNLLNYRTRYNIRLTPGRNFLRNRNFINGFLQKKLSSGYSFTYGEGNYKMASTMIADGCPGDNSGVNLVENQNISVTTEYLHLVDKYDTSIDLIWSDYAVIVANRKYCVGVSRTESNYKKFFIKELTYEINSAKCSNVVWGFDASPIQVMAIVTENPGEFPTQECIDFCEEERITEDGETRITEDGEVRIIENGDCTSEYVEFYHADFDIDLDGWTSEGIDIPAPTLQALSGWTNNTGGTDWATGSAPATSENSGQTSNYIRGTFSSNGGTSYSFGYQITIAGADPTSGSFTFAILDSGGSVVTSQAVAFNTNGVWSGTVSLTPLSNGSYFAIKVANTTPFNTKSFQINTASYSGSATHLPSWIWDSGYGGSAKNGTTIEDHGVKNLVKTSATLPQRSSSIDISFAVPTNNSDVSLRFRIKNSGGTVIYEDVFASTITDGSEQTITLEMTDSAVWTACDKFEILVESSDFDNGDLFYITDFKIYYYD